MSHNELIFQVKPNLKLAADAWGDSSHPPLLFLHGGGQTRYAWTETAQYLAQQGWYAVAVDQRGHGDSDWAEDGDYRMFAFAEDLMELARQCPQPPVVIGASLGGIAALFAQERAHPSLFAAIILVDIAPRMEKSGVERIIQFMQAHSEEGFAHLEEAADAIAAYLPHRKKRTNPEGLKKNLRLHPDGRYRWHWDPRFMADTHSSYNLDVKKRQASLEAAAQKLTIPTLLVRGRSSDLISEQAVAEFLQLVPHAKFVDVAEAGHMVAGDRNDLFQEAIVNFLETLRQELGKEF